MLRTSILLLVLLLSAASSAQAQVTNPNTFTDGTPAIASEMNANFTALAVAIESVCADGGGTWDTEANTCAPTYDCYLAGWCANTAEMYNALIFGPVHGARRGTIWMSDGAADPPSAFDGIGPKNRYTGHTLTTEPPLSQCNARLYLYNWISAGTKAQAEIGLGMLTRELVPQSRFPPFKVGLLGIVQVIRRTCPVPLSRLASL
jgi:hypothetical protein